MMKFSEYLDWNFSRPMIWPLLHIKILFCRCKTFWRDVKLHLLLAYRSGWLRVHRYVHVRYKLHFVNFTMRTKTSFAEEANLVRKLIFAHQQCRHENNYAKQSFNELQTNPQIILTFIKFLLPEPKQDQLNCSPSLIPSCSHSPLKGNFVNSPRTCKFTCKWIHHLHELCILTNYSVKVWSRNILWEKRDMIKFIISRKTLLSVASLRH